MATMQTLMRRGLHQGLNAVTKNATTGSVKHTQKRFMSGHGSIEENIGEESKHAQGEGNICAHIGMCLCVRAPGVERNNREKPPPVCIYICVCVCAAEMEKWKKVSLVAIPACAGLAIYTFGTMGHHEAHEKPVRTRT